MALLEKESTRLWLGIGIGAGAAAAAPWVLPVLAAIARPLLKVAISQSLLAAERGREGIARLGETIADVVAEVKAEAAARTHAEREALVQEASSIGGGSGVRGEPN